MPTKLINEIRGIILKCVSLGIYIQRTIASGQMGTEMAHLSVLTTGILIGTCINTEGDVCWRSKCPEGESVLGIL